MYKNIKNSNLGINSPDPKPSVNAPGLISLSPSPNVNAPDRGVSPGLISLGAGVNTSGRGFGVNAPGRGLAPVGGIPFVLGSGVRTPGLGSVHWTNRCIAHAAMWNHTVHIEKSDMFNYDNGQVVYTCRNLTKTEVVCNSTHQKSVKAFLTHKKNHCPSCSLLGGPRRK